VSSGSLAPVGFGDPQTLLLIGNDQRNHTTTTPVLPHSNEMLLVRIDPGKPWISMMSIPRELEVTLQTAGGPVKTRLNAALIYGGFPLLLSTIKQLTGLSINHVVENDFNQFKTAVDQIGCVYATVDRRYYHVNTASSAQYQEINLQPGYQKLCGTQALQFVSYRHGDTSLVRDARDQDFLLDVKKQYGPALADLGTIHKFEQIFGHLVDVDRELQTEGGWHVHGAVYWIHNTLTDAVSNGELLAIAEQTKPIGTPGAPGSPIGRDGTSGHARLKDVVVPTRIGTPAKTTPAETIGLLGGLLTLIAVPPLFFGLLHRRRNLATLRAQLHATLEHKSHLRSMTLPHN
jgi:LCP family protein required for cell wall assembly